MIEKLISIIMPAYNAEKFIEESINSVLEQTYINWELLVIDDGSTDRTSEIVRIKQNADNRIYYFFQENGKQGKARNRGIKESRGEYIAFLDSDDLWLPEKLKVTFQEIIAGGNSLVFTDSYVFYGDKKNISSLITLGVKNEMFQGESGVLKFFEYNRIPNLTVLVRREILNEVGGFSDAGVAEDYEMWLKLLAKGYSFTSINIPLALYRIHTESTTSKDRLATFEAVQIIKSFTKEHPEYIGDTKIILKKKIKYWLSNGENLTLKNFRMIIKDVYSLPVFLIMSLSSYFFPIIIIRKIVIAANFFKL
jgi:teichuronic acid biosynthesis glycosyltransferase TuaG